MSAIIPSHAAIRSDIASAIRTASARTDVDADYLFRQAEIESGFDPSARARTSSATGLYQFIDQTWLRTVKAHGAKHGLGWAAERIQVSASGRYSAGAAQADILALRKDPAAAAAMAAEFASDNRDFLESRLGRAANDTDLYMAHFLGAGGAAKFLSSLESVPDRPAAELMPGAARANRPVFYTREGRPRSLAEVYERFAAKFGTSTERAAPTPQRAEPAGWSQAQLDAVQATRDWIASRVNRAGQQEMGTSPASARLVYLMLSSSASI